MSYIYPIIELLKRQLESSEITEKVIDEMQVKLQSVIDAHKVDASIVAHRKSPLNIIFDVQKGTGVLKKDIEALSKNMEVEIGLPVTVFADSGFHISVTHANKEFVRTRTVFEGDADNKEPLDFAIGIDENGKTAHIDLSDSPHLMISGSTGTGKTVLVDDIIANIVFKASPEEVKLMLIDPVLADFKVYRDLPHLICPVLRNKGEITDAMKLIADEIDYRKNTINTRNLREYNKKAKSKLPVIVVIIDKYSELTYEMPKEFLEYAKKIAAQGRFCGIHLIINTQSPFVESVPGDLKNNLTTRVAFSLASEKEMQSAIGYTGAYKFKGSGEVLISSIQNQIPVYAQVGYISYMEIEGLVRFLKQKNGAPVYDEKYANIHKEYVISEDVDYIKRILEYLAKKSVVNVKSFIDDLKVSRTEAYEIINFLVLNEYIDPVAKGSHIVNYDKVMETLNEMTD